MCFFPSSAPAAPALPPPRPQQTETEIRAEQQKADEIAREKQRARVRAKPGISQTFGPSGIAGALIGQIDESQQGKL